MSMGSSLFPIVANLVMQELEKTCIKKLPFNLELSFNLQKIWWYCRLIDSIVIATQPHNIDIILKIFNSFHSRLNLIGIRYKYWIKKEFRIDD